MWNISRKSRLLPIVTSSPINPTISTFKLSQQRSLFQTLPHYAAASTLLSVALSTPVGATQIAKVSCGPNLATYIVSQTDSKTSHQGIRCLKLSNAIKRTIAREDIPAFSWYGEGTIADSTKYRVVGHAFYQGKNLTGYASTLDGSFNYPQLSVKIEPGGVYPAVIRLQVNKSRGFVNRPETIETWVKVEKTNYQVLKDRISGCSKSFRTYKIIDPKLVLGRNSNIWSCSLNTLPPKVQLQSARAGSIATWVRFTDDGKTLKLGSLSGNGYNETTICFPGKYCDRFEEPFTSVNFTPTESGFNVKTFWGREIWVAKASI